MGDTFVCLTHALAFNAKRHLLSVTVYLQEKCIVTCTTMHALHPLRDLAVQSFAKRTLGSNH